MSIHGVLWKHILAANLGRHLAVGEEQLILGSTLGRAQFVGLLTLTRLCSLHGKEPEGVRCGVGRSTGHEAPMVFLVSLFFYVLDKLIFRKISGNTESEGKVTDGSFTRTCQLCEGCARLLVMCGRAVIPCQPLHLHFANCVQPVWEGHRRYGFLQCGLYIRCFWFE